MKKKRIKNSRFKLRNRVKSIKTSKLLNSNNRFSRSQLLVFVAVFTLLGAYILHRSFAAGSYASFEGENASLSGPAAVGSDSNASGGKYIKFGSALPGNLAFPVHAAFYYPLFPEDWTVGSSHVAFHPTLGYYDSMTQSVVDSQIGAMTYAKMDVAIASWMGVNNSSENTRIPLLLNRTVALGSTLKWALYYEPEATGDPTVAQIQSDLEYIKANYVNNEAVSSVYAHVNNKPVLFVDNKSANDNSCALATKWAQANATEGFYIALKILSGYKTCTDQPDTWHGYNASLAEDNYAGYSFAISPGFWPANATSATLARSPTTWQTNVNDMKASAAPWELVTSFNDWANGTSVESATEWSSSSGNGTYLDALHNSL